MALSKTRQSRLFGNQWKAYLFLLPALLIYSVFVVYPFLRTIFLTFFTGIGTKALHFYGIQNYLNLVADPVFWRAFRNNIFWAAMVLIIPVSFGLFLAVLLSRNKMRGRTFFRTVLFFPQVITPVIVAMIWRWMYSPSFGPVNVFLTAIGLGSLAHGWLGNSSQALPALAIGYSWAYYGFCMVIFIAALQGVDETLFDAAKIDGANSIQEFWYVTLPAIRLELTTVLLFTLIESFKIFDIVYVGTRGGPGYSTWVISFYVYDYTWNQFKVGYGATAAVMQTVFVGLITAAFIWYRRRLKNQS
jgi:raffinose/stachyose/melibiose transport system permease protein